MTKEDISDTLEAIAQLLDLKGENPFKIRAYQTAARSVQTYAGNIEETAANGELDRIDGIGKAIAEKMSELIRTGRLVYFEELKASFPPRIFELFEISGLGAKKIKLLHDKLGVTSVDDLEKAIRDGRVAALPGLGEKTAQNLLSGIEQRLRHAAFHRLGDVAGLAFRILASLREHPDVIRASEGGSFRRRKELVRDLDFVASTREPGAVGDFFATRPEVEEVIAHGPTKVSVRLKDGGVQCDLRLVSETEYPYAQHHFTGSKEHNIALRNRALERGWSINEYRISAARETHDPLPEVRDETEFYRALGLDYIPPELRENLGEIDAAARHALPDLIEYTNLRGTFHCHTTASDGHNTLEEMAAAAQALGLQYLGVADHSKSSIQANGQDEARLAAQGEAIRRLNAQYARDNVDFRLFAGVECDILRDGALDFSDAVLASLDYVVVSAHNVFNLPEAEMTRRFIRAMENPYVTMVGHLTGRLLLSREGYALDIPAILAAAAATDTIIELNANTRRLDMDWRWWHRAKDQGVKCAINPDAHRTEGLQDLWFGVAQARKGWLTRGDVVNTLPLGQIEGALGAKRAGK